MRSNAAKPHRRSPRRADARGDSSRSAPSLGPAAAGDHAVTPMRRRRDPPSAPIRADEQRHVSARSPLRRRHRHPAALTFQSQPARASRSRRGDESACRGTRFAGAVEPPQLGRADPPVVEPGDLDDRRAIAAQPARARLVAGEMDDDRRRLGEAVVDRLDRHRRDVRRGRTARSGAPPHVPNGHGSCSPSRGSSRRTHRAPGRPRRRGSRRR